MHMFLEAMVIDEVVTEDSCDQVDEEASDVGDDQQAKDLTPAVIFLPVVWVHVRC